MVFSVLSMYLLQDRQATVSLSKIILMVLMSTAVAVTIGAPFASMSLWGESGAFVAHVFGLLETLPLPGLAKDILRSGGAWVNETLSGWQTCS